MKCKINHRQYICFNVLSMFAWTGRFLINDFKALTLTLNCTKKNNEVLVTFTEIILTGKLHFSCSAKLGSGSMRPEASNLSKAMLIP